MGTSSRDSIEADTLVLKGVSFIGSSSLPCRGAGLQEYLGSFTADESGRLRFREGALVTALRLGQWLVLDELNLAPTEVLEALNRRVPLPRALPLLHLHAAGAPPCCW